MALCGYVTAIIEVVSNVGNVGAQCHAHSSLTTKLVGQLLHSACQEVVGAAVEVQLLQRVPPMCIIASTDQNDIGLKPDGCWLDDLVESKAGCSLSRTNCKVRSSCCLLCGYYFADIKHSTRSSRVKLCDSYWSNNIGATSNMHLQTSICLQSNSSRIKICDGTFYPSQHLSRAQKMDSSMND